MTISQLYLPNHRFHSPLVKTYFTITSHIFHLPLQGVYLRPTFELSRQSRCGLYWSCSSGQKAAWVDKIFISKSWDLVPEVSPANFLDRNLSKIINVWPQIKAPTVALSLCWHWYHRAYQLISLIAIWIFISKSWDPRPRGPTSQFFGQKSE